MARRQAARRLSFTAAAADPPGSTLTETITMDSQQPAVSPKNDLNDQVNNLTIAVEAMTSLLAHTIGAQATLDQRLNALVSIHPAPPLPNILTASPSITHLPTAVSNVDVQLVDAGLSSPTILPTLDADPGVPESTTHPSMDSKALALEQGDPVLKTGGPCIPELLEQPSANLQRLLKLKVHDADLFSTSGRRFTTNGPSLLAFMQENRKDLCPALEAGVRNPGAVAGTAIQAFLSETTSWMSPLPHTKAAILLEALTLNKDTFAAAMSEDLVRSRTAAPNSRR